MWSAQIGGVIWCQLAFSDGSQRSLYCERKKGGRGGEDERGWENCGLMESVGLERECERREGGGQRER